MKEFWRKRYTFIIPTFFACLYAIMIYMNKSMKFQIPLIQQSKNVENMLEGYITFTSIILSVFGFLMPTYASSKTRTREYFQKHADMKLFSNSLRRVVVMGLFSVVLSCFIFLYDLMNLDIQNFCFIIWIWVILHFIFSAYRYISLLIRIIFTGKSAGNSGVVNPPSEDVKDKIKQNVKIHKD